MTDYRRRDSEWREEIAAAAAAAALGLAAFYVVRLWLAREPIVEEGSTGSAGRGPSDAARPDAGAPHADPEATRESPS